MKKCKFLFTAVLLTLFIAPSQGQNQHFKDVGFDVFPAHHVHGCNGETVDISEGVLHYNVQGNINNGELSVRINVNFNLTGTGQSSGLTYRCISAQQQTHNMDASGTRISYDVIQVLIAQGGGNGSNLIVKVSGALEFDGEGNVTNYIEDVSFDCPGS